MYINQEMLIEEVVRLRTNIENGVSHFNRKALKRCEKIEQQLNLNELDPKSLIKIKYKLLKIKKFIDSGKTKEKNIVVIYSIYIIVCFELLLIFYKFAAPVNSVFYNIFFFLSLAILGYLGALTHLYTKGFKATDAFEFRALLALIFPIMFLNIFRIENEQIVGVHIVNLIIFIAGYNAEVLFGVLNKLVDMAKRAVNISDKDVGIELERRDSVSD
ncbi:hypothetical protein ABES58_23590 [Paenibacillus lautus]|uniref:hypothetical protein n=1 Tax=Paenibacillus lautus TaxID=1401 RepID=UPI003D2AC21F